MPKNNSFPPYCISTDNLEFSRGSVPVFSGVNLSLSFGEVLMIRGGNGSGKTSLLRILAGFSNFYSGKIRYRLANNPWINGPAHGAIGWMGHKNGLSLELTVEENLVFWQKIFKSHVQISQTIDRVGLSDFKNQTARSLSAGQFRRLNLAKLLLGNWPVWILDEPSANLDRKGRQLIEGLLVEHTKNGGSAIIASHEPLHPGAPTSFIQLHQDNAP